ncbi:metallophosphoesterase [Acidocella sp.]|uniref:metallophosphoesterase n=1 Tax=Acidocella sp. TaxID=50710 RepID=UPI00261AE6A9|nr:phosphoesterase [Acidocella sp.]
MLDPAGAAFWPGKRVLIAADPPFAALSAFAHQPADSRGALERLNRLVRLYRPAKVIMLGHGGVAGAARLHKDERARLAAMAREASFIWVAEQASDLPGSSVAMHREGPFTFRHEPSARLAPREIEICGALRPWASIDVRAKRVARPCFVADANRLMLPAFASAAGPAGTISGGLDVRDSGISRLFPRGLRVFLLGQDQLFSFALEQLGRMAEVA